MFGVSYIWFPKCCRKIFFVKTVSGMCGVRITPELTYDQFRRLSLFVLWVIERDADSKTLTCVIPSEHRGAA